MAASQNHILHLQEAHWQLWYQDVFDPDCPRQLEHAGQGLVAGLIALWIHHLRESVLPDGQLGFARFNLWLPQEKRSLTIQSTGMGMVKLKQWVFQPDPVFDPSASGLPDALLLSRIAEGHSRLIAKGVDEDQLCQIAAQSENRDEFFDAIAEI